MSTRRRRNRPRSSSRPTHPAPASSPRPTAGSVCAAVAELVTPRVIRWTGRTRLIGCGPPVGPPTPGGRHSRRFRPCDRRRRLPADTDRFRRNSGRRSQDGRMAIPDFKRIRFLIPVAVVGVALAGCGSSGSTSSPSSQANSNSASAGGSVGGSGGHPRQPEVPALQQPEGRLLDQVPRGLGPEGLREPGHVLGQGQQRPDRRYPGPCTDRRIGHRRAPQGGGKGPDVEGGHASTGEGGAQPGDSRRQSRPGPGRSGDRQEAHADGRSLPAWEQGPGGDSRRVQPGRVDNVDAYRLIIESFQWS